MDNYTLSITIKDLEDKRDQYLDKFDYITYSHLNTTPTNELSENARNLKEACEEFNNYIQKLKQISNQGQPFSNIIENRIHKNIHFASKKLAEINITINKILEE